MTASLRALLAGSIDYAGMFPPASLELPRALEPFRRYRADERSWMLGRFVMPASQLPELGAVYQPRRDGQLTVTFPPSDNRASFSKILDATLCSVAQFPASEAIDMLELRWPTEHVRDCDTSRLRDVLHLTAERLAALRLPPMTLFVELPRTGPASDPSSHSVRNRQIRTAVTALAEYNDQAGTLNCPAGYKLRCGGTKPEETPPSTEVTQAILACRDSGVSWKATAGLHHPIRHLDPNWRAPVHGFVNVFCATIFAEMHGLDERQTQTIIDETDPRQFTFSDTALAWRDRVVQAEQIEPIRKRSLRSFGSCSFEEPCQDLRNLELLP